MMIKNSKKFLAIQNNFIKLKKNSIFFDYIQINIASHFVIKKWAERILPNGKIIGEIKTPLTINQKTKEPILNGLFCEKIFGPLKSWHCKCGKYKGFLNFKICEKCYVEITDTNIRKYRMGYINLNYPIIHSWYLNSYPNYIYLFLKLILPFIKISDIYELIYYKNKKNYFKVITYFKNFLNKYTSIFTKANFFGNEYILNLFYLINLKSEIKLLRDSLIINLLETKINLKKLRLLETFLTTNIKPIHLILTLFPVLPPKLRPLYEVETTKILSSNINDLYCKLILLNNKILTIVKKDVETCKKNQRYLGLLFDKKLQVATLLQQTSDLLIDNTIYNNELYLKNNNKVIKSLTELLEGKYGRFRHLLLGKRLDYSARSIIIIGPHLRLNQAGVPFTILKTLYEPFIINYFLKYIFKISKFKVTTYKIITDLKTIISVIINNNKPLIWRILNNLIRNSSVLLNRSPTLHKFGLQAFNPILSNNKTILLHPLLCTGFNADFDGDQMAIYLPLAKYTQYEVYSMMRPSYHILTPVNGTVVLKPAQDTIIGCYYLTLMYKNLKHITHYSFNNELEAFNLFSKKKIQLHTPILIRYKILLNYFKIFNNEIYFQKVNFFFLFMTKKIKILKRFNFLQKYFFITNFGIISSLKYKKNLYKSINIFLETTIGRLIFKKTYNLIIK
jgi:DNA-directed RNA polymerase subunit beta'